MLPDYPSLKSRMMKERMAAFQRDMDAKMPIVSKIKAVRFHEGHSFSFERTDGVIDVQEFLDIKKPVTISAQLEFNQTVNEIKDQMENLADGMAAHLEQLFIANFEKITAEVGNAIDMRGAPFSLESYLDMLDRVEIDFDAFGFPVWPTPAGSSKMLETMKQEFERFRTSSLLRDRADAIVRKKREEWRDRESRRRLVS